MSDTGSKEVAPVAAAGKLLLPAKGAEAEALVDSIVKAIGVPREVLAPREHIDSAWEQLPLVFQKVPQKHRTEPLARMLVAVSVGLFDSAINYVWNLTISALRDLLRTFGLQVIAQLQKKDFGENELLSLQDFDLIDLCFKLNLISQDAHFYLQQCRDIRNNYSVAHPSGAMVDNFELLNFFNRCAKYGLETQPHPVGVDAQDLLSALKAGRFKADQEAKWVNDIRNTHDYQRSLIFPLLHGIYCDPNSSEETRLNCIALVSGAKDKLSQILIGELISQHQSYVGKGDDVRVTASRVFFEKLNLFGELGESERHLIITSACKRLVGVHNAMNNFYNEPPFAERLAELARQGAIPASAQAEFVASVMYCAVGNKWGHCWAAAPNYRELVKGFSQNEIRLMLELSVSKDPFAIKLRDYKACRAIFKELLTLVSPESIPVVSKPLYEKWQKEL